MLSRRVLVILVVALLVLAIGGFLYFRDRKLTCPEWGAEVHQWEQEGGVALFGDYTEGAKRPQLTGEDQYEIVVRMLELQESKPEGCR